jgi:hypothetical protein
MKLFVALSLSLVVVAGADTALCADTSELTEHKLAEQALSFLREMTRDVIQASRVQPGSNGGGDWSITNSCGFALLTPGKDTYRAFWIRDFSMALDSGLIDAQEISNHLILVCRVQNGSQERNLADGLHIPPWAIPDHINYDGRPVWFPGTYSSGDNQGTGTFGRLPPIDDHYDFVHMAYSLWKSARDSNFLRQQVDGVTIYERLENAFRSPTIDSLTELVETNEKDRAVGFGFCDAEVHTGKLLFASLLRYRAAGELSELGQAIGRSDAAANYRSLQQTMRSHLSDVFKDPRSTDGWLRASTGLSSQADVWGTLFALRLGVLEPIAAKAAQETVAQAVTAKTITLEGAVRHVPTDKDFSKSSAWERSYSAVNTYQNGAYWHTASGWLIEALWQQNRDLALQEFKRMITHLETQDYRKSSNNGAPWEAFGPNGRARQNGVYLASVALPFSVLQRLLY